MITTYPGIKKMQVILCSVLAFFFVTAVGRCPAQTHPAQGNVVYVEVVGLHSSKGQISCSLFSSVEGFPKNVDKGVAHVFAPISDQRAVCAFPGIASGIYAVSVFHDENLNGKLDTNFLGVPREGVGASNDAKGHMGPPKFDSAKFQFAGGRLNLKITINYLRGVL